MIIEFEQQLLELIDARIASASDDELFAGGYLRGHISLAAAECEEQNIYDIEQLKQRIQASLAAARAELTPADQSIVHDLWLALLDQL